MGTDKAKILIVDDHDLTLELMRTSLHGRGYQIATATNGKEALAVAASFQPDTILLDIMMPGISGFETCYMLRRQPGTAHTPILFISAKNTLDDRLEGFSAGGNDFIKQPFDKSELCERVEQLVRIKKERDELATKAEEAGALALHVMNDAAKNGEIGRFIQECLFCRNLVDLTEQFVAVAKKLGLHFTVRICLDSMVITRTDDGIARPLEDELLKRSQEEQLNKSAKTHIYRFDDHRVMFNWAHVSLLVKNIADEIDNVAILLNGFNAGIRAISTDKNLVNAIAAYKTENEALKAGVSKIFDHTLNELKETLFNIGAATNLSEDDENCLLNVVERGRTGVDGLFEQSQEMDEILTNVIENSKAESHQQKGNTAGNVVQQNDDILF